MAQGTQRREGTQDSLTGASEITPSIPQAPQLQIPNASVPDVVNNMSSQVARSLSKWSTQKFQEKASKEHEKSILDGQTAYQQNKAMEDLEVPGDKWAMQGYRVMQAQTLSSAFLASQRAMVKEKDYADDLDTYRAKYVQRMEAQLEGLDPKTARMVREQSAEHMPTLVAEQVLAHVAYEENNAFNTLATSIDTMSKDPTALDALLSNAIGGEGSASAFLGPDRTRSAVVQGTVQSFENGNPIAYQQLKSSGLFEELPHEEQQALEASKKQYDVKVSQTYDAEHVEAMSNFTANNEAGLYEPHEVVDVLAAIYAKQGLDVSASVAGAAYAASVRSNNENDRADVVVLETALARGDLPAVAALTYDAVSFHDAGSDPELGNVGNMELTIGGGQEHWANLITAHNGDIEAAAIAYGFSPEDAESVLKSVNGENLYYDSGEMLSIRDSQLVATQKLKASMEKTIAQGVEDAEKQNAINLEHEYNLEKIPYTQQLNAGIITSSEFLTETSKLLTNKGIVMSKWISRALAGDVRTSGLKLLAKETKLNNELIASGKEIKGEEKKHAIAAYVLAESELSLAYQEAIDIPGLTAQDLSTLRHTYLEKLTDLASLHGLNLHESKMGAFNNQAITTMQAAQDSNEKYANEQVVLEDAKTNGTVGALSPVHQKRAWEQGDKEVNQLVADKVARNEISEEEAPATLIQARNEMMIQYGSAPPSVKAQGSAIMSRELVSDAGVVNAQAVSFIQQWNAMYQDHPEVADTMLNEKGSLKAQAVLALAGGNFATSDDLAQAMVAYEKQFQYNASLNTDDHVADSTRTSGLIDDAVENYFDAENIGIAQALFSSTADIDQTSQRTATEREQVFSETEVDDLTFHVTDEAQRLQKLSPNQNAGFYVDKAVTNIIARTSIIGTDVLTMQRGFGIKGQLFGDAAADITKDGVEQEVIIHAIKALAESDPDKWGWLTEFSFREESGPAFRTLMSVTDAALGVVGADLELPKLSFRDTQDGIRRGIRPFKITAVDGKRVLLRAVHPQNGLSEYLPITMREAGTAWRTDYIKEISEQKKKASVRTSRGMSLSQ